ncbi:MAG: protein serine/threonine phosphatase [Bacteroidetes bacterium]|nr:protein serine/threonine phosphatase [Bacteroidota bacterium]
MAFTSFSQNLNIIDSLKKVAEIAKDDTAKTNLLNKISTAYLEINLENSLDFAKRSLGLSEKMGYKKGMAQAYFLLGNISNYKAEHLEAITWFKKSLLIRKELFLMSDVSQTYSSIGYCYEDMGNFPEAKNNYIASLKIREQLKDKIGIAKCNSNIGNIYFQTQNLEEALKFLIPALKVFEEAGEKRMIAAISHNIGTIYIYQNKPEAINLLQTALKINEEMGNRFWKSNNLTALSELYRKQGDFAEAKKCLNSALIILEESGQKEGMINIYNLLSKLNMSQKKYNDANVNLNKALILAISSNSITKRQTCYENLAELEKYRGNYQKALEYFKLSVVLRDSIFSEENIKKMTQQQMQYDFDKKEALTKEAQERKDILTQKEIQNQKNLRNALTGGLMLVLLAATLFFFQRNKINKEKKKSDSLLHLVEEKQKEILDSISYARRLQEAILPPKEFLNKFIPDNFIFYKPKDIVAGDFYWAEAINDLFFIAAADSTGHGVPGAMVSVVCSNALNRTVKEFKETDTGKILDKTRELVLETFEKSTDEVKDGMDISLLCIDRKNNSITWSGANNPLWYTHNNELKEIKANKQPIGQTDKPMPFTTQQIDFSPGTTFYLFTDGFADQFGGPKGKKFKYKQLKELLLSISNEWNDTTLQKLNVVFNNWKGQMEQVDDVCVIGIRV